MIESVKLASSYLKSTIKPLSQTNNRMKNLLLCYSLAVLVVVNCIKKAKETDEELLLASACSGNSTCVEQIKSQKDLEDSLLTEMLISDDYVSSFDTELESLASQPLPPCPEFDNTYLDTHNAVNQRSITPWVWRINRNKNRIPRYIIESKCLCDYCIDLATRRQNMRLISSPIHTERLILMKQSDGTITEEMEYFTSGCRCVIPIENNSK